MLVIALVAILAAVASPSLLSGVDRSRTWTAARYLAARMIMARTQAVMRTATVALRFTPSGGDIAFQMVVDNNHNGVRTADIAAGIDRPLGEPVRLGQLFPRVAIAIEGLLGLDPVRVGSSNLLSFTPSGTATSGTIYIRGRDGTQLAVRVLGATGRTRVLQYVPHTRRWIESF